MAKPMHRDVTAYLSVKDAPKALAWYRDVFGATLVQPPLKAGDLIVHAEFHIGDTPLFLAEAAEDASGPPSVRMALHVEDADAVVAAAEAAGAEVLIPVDDQFYGHRAGRIRDPFGHVWIVCQAIEAMSPEEMQRRLDAMMRGEG